MFDFLSGLDQQNSLSIISIVTLLCLLAATLRITMHRHFKGTDSFLVHALSHPAWCVTLLVFMPRALEGFAKGSISPMPWNAFADGFSPYSAALALNVLVIDLWMFFAAGQLATIWVNRNEALSEAEKRSERIFFIVVNLLAGLLVVKQADNFYRVLQNINATTAYFMIIIAVLATYFHATFTPSVVAKAPAILTTCGILGTFLGVAIGLMSFNPNDVQGSVPVLMDGIKMAFWASTCGIFFALTIKLREVFFGVRRSQKSAGRATMGDLVIAMTSVQRALAGKEESSLLSQIRRSNERLDALAGIMESFCKQAEKNSDKKAA